MSSDVSHAKATRDSTHRASRESTGDAGAVADGPLPATTAASRATQGDRDQSVTQLLARTDRATRAGIFRSLQGLIGNAAMQRVARQTTAGQARAAHRESPNNPRAGPPALVQRYQAGESGHEGIEQRALGAAGFSEAEVSQVYFGNWLRDLSQLPPNALPLVNLLALGEFNRELTAEELGAYVPSEHLDNPEGGGTVEDPRIQALQHSANPAERAEFEAALNRLSPVQRAAYDREQQHRHEIVEASHRSGLPEYIERGKLHAREKLTEAVRLGATSEGRQAMGEALHAIEDYFSHSNFVEAAIWALYREGAPVGALVDRMAQTALGTNAALAGGLDQNGEPQIVTGTYMAGGNDWVSKLELLKTEVEHGQLTKAFILGWFRKQGITGEQVGQALGRGAGQNLGGQIGATVGGVAGTITGAGRGAAEGWRTHHGIGAVAHGVAGLFTGAAEGAAEGTVEGWQSGAETGGRIGETAGGATGHGVGIAAASLEALVAVTSATLLFAAFPAIPAAMAALFAAARSDPVIEAAVEHQTQASAEQASAAGLQGPTHSQIAKDAPDHPLFGVSTQLAEHADREIGLAIQNAWRTPDQDRAEATPAVTRLVGRFVSRPGDSANEGWWRPIVLGAARR